MAVRNTLINGQVLQQLRTPLLPLDRRRRLPRDVVNDPVDSAHFIDDAIGNPPEQFMRQQQAQGGGGAGPRPVPARPAT